MLSFGRWLKSHISKLRETDFGPLVDVQMADDKNKTAHERLMRELGILRAHLDGNDRRHKTRRSEDWHSF